jgi:tetratricopeptide (TPR) repeat protein
MLQLKWEQASPEVRRRTGLKYYLARAEVRHNAVNMAACVVECDSAMRYCRSGHAEDEAPVNSWKSKAFVEMGDYAIAHRLLDDALSVFSGLGETRKMAECNNEIGWVHFIQEQYALAERSWRTMLAQAREVGDLRLEAIALRRVGLACLYLYDPDDLGHAYYDSALVASRRLGDPRELAGIHSNLGRYMDSALYYAKASGDQAWYYRIMHTAGSELVNEGDATGALQYCEPVLAFAKRSGNRMLQRDAAACLCEAYQLLGRWKEAFLAQDEWRGINDQMISSRSRDQIAMRAMGREFEARAREDSISHAAELERLESARTIERLRADRNRNSALALGSGALLLLTGGAALYRLDRKRRRERFDRDRARLETHVLRTQMNPHFIFNALNSINSYIQENERDLASGFLTKFARLMRLVLENSRHNEVPLVQDLEALRLYMELEQSRMNGKFDYSIEVDAALDQAETMVPPLVMQPFVENAIWHGISRKEGKGHIKLIVRKYPNRLTMSVEDDGVGRGASSTHPAPDGAPPKSSLGTTITQDRLSLLGKQRGGEAGFRFMDLEAGTRVEVELPIQDIAR